MILNYFEKMVQVLKQLELDGGISLIVSYYQRIDWLRKNSSCLEMSRQDTLFLVENSKVIAELSTSTNKKEFLKKFQMVISESQDKKKKDFVESDQSFTHLNEDDCYDVDNIEVLRWILSLDTIRSY